MSLDDQLRHSIDFTISNKELSERVKMAIEDERKQKRIAQTAYDFSSEKKITPEQFYNTKLFNHAY